MAILKLGEIYKADSFESFDYEVANSGEKWVFSNKINQFGNLLPHVFNGLNTESDSGYNGFFRSFV